MNWWWLRFQVFPTVKIPVTVFSVVTRYTCNVVDGYQRFIASIFRIKMKMAVVCSSKKDTVFVVILMVKKLAASQEPKA
jgi:hypothetical protein